MEKKEGLPFVKIMMLISGMSPLFILMSIKGFGGFGNNPISNIFYKSIINLTLNDVMLITCLVLIIIPLFVLKWRLFLAERNSDTITINVSKAKHNKEYLFTYFLTVLLPLFSLQVENYRDVFAIIIAIIMIIFILWNMNFHFINLYFAILGYRIFVLESFHGAILLTNRHAIDKEELNVHKISNSVFIELKGHSYGSSN